MTTKNKATDAAYSAVLAHSSYAGLAANTPIPDQIRELIRGLHTLAAEYGVSTAAPQTNDTESIQIAFDLEQATVHQQVRITHADYTEERILDGLRAGKLTTTAWFDEGEKQTIDIQATGESVAEIVSQELDGIYSDYR